MVFTKLDEGELIAEFFKRNKIQALLENLEKDILPLPTIVWTLFALELWYGTHFKGQR